jgi:hypothetical protein
MLSTEEIRQHICLLLVARVLPVSFFLPFSARLVAERDLNRVVPLRGSDLRQRRTGEAASGQSKGRRNAAGYYKKICQVFEK